MRQFIIFILVTLFVNEIYSQTSYKVNNSLTLKNTNCDLSKISLILPVPYTNDYQTINNLEYSSGDVLTAVNNSNKYLRDLKTSGLPIAGNNYTLSTDFDVTLYPMYIDFDQFKEIYPYNEQSSEYKQYTSENGEYINPGNTQIKQISSELWKQAEGEIITYARLCYEYVAANFKYLNPNTGLYPLTTILANGGGDCGNLTSIYVSLLRSRGIPSRHIVTLRPNGSFHVWADFYLEKYGWIPVDVNMKLDYPEGNYFGYCKGDGIIMSIGINNEIEYEPNKKYSAALLQTYFWWYWYNGAGDQMELTHTVNSSQLNRPDIPQITDVKSSQATIKITPRSGATGYLVKLYNSDNMNIPIREYRYDTNKTQLILDNLTPQTSYVASVAACRKVNMIETTMGYNQLHFVTNESPTGIESIEQKHIVNGSNGYIKIQMTLTGVVSVYSITGHVVYNQELASGNYSVPIPNGIYIVRITDKNGNHWTHKINCRE